MFKKDLNQRLIFIKIVQENREGVKNQMIFQL